MWPLPTIAWPSHPLAQGDEATALPPSIVERRGPERHLTPPPVAQAIALRGIPRQDRLGLLQPGEETERRLRSPDGSKSRSRGRPFRRRSVAVITPVSSAASLPPAGPATTEAGVSPRARHDPHDEGGPKRPSLTCDEYPA